MGASKYTKKVLAPIVASSNSIRNVLDDLKLSPSGSNYSHIKSRIEKCNIDMSHFTGQGWNKGRRGVNAHTKESFKEKVLVRNGPEWNNSAMKFKMLEYALINNQCAKCGMDPIWNGKPLSLHLDHIDGDRRNNLRENHRLLCPNCHSQTPTYSKPHNQRG